MALPCSSPAFLQPAAMPPLRRTRPAAAILRWDPPAAWVDARFSPATTRGIVTSAAIRWRPTPPLSSPRWCPGNAIHLDLGTTEDYYGIPWVVVPAGQPMVTIEFGTDGADYSDESDPGPMPIPLNAPIEGGSAADPDPASGDRHVLVIQQGDCVLYELYNAVRTSNGFRVSSSARWDLKVNATREPGWTSADAAGLPILPGLLKYGEVSAGAINHALRFTIPHVRRAYVAPASHCGQYADAALPPYGTRVRLRADFPLAPYTGDALVVLTAFKKYGLILADQGSAWYVTGASDPGWESALDQLRQHPVRGSDFEVLQGGAMTTC